MAYRILHVVRSLDRYTPAADLLALCGAMPANEFVHQVVVLGRTGPLADDFSKAGIDFRCLEQRWTYDPTTLVRLRYYVRACGPQLVHAWGEAAGEYAEVALRRSAPAVLIASRDHVWLGGPRVRWPLPNWWRKQPVRLVVASEWIKSAIENRSVSQCDCTVIPQCVAAAGEEQTPREQLLKDLQLPADAQLIGVAGPLQPRYGVKELIWAADMVRVLHPSMRLLIVGDGPQREHLERFAETAAEPANIVFLGDTDRWPDVVPHLDVYWQGTEANATPPTTLLEAMAAGVPVVASDTPAHREIVTNDQSGYLVGIDDRAGRTRVTDLLLTDRDQARKIGNAGRFCQREQFALVRRAEQFAELYRQLLGK